MKVAIFAGTPKDTDLGYEIIEKNGFIGKKFPLSNSPKEQSKLQYYSKELLEEKFLFFADEALKWGADKFFIYCNSLSSALDFKKLSKKLDIEIITPFDVYEKFSKKYKNIFIMTANAIASYKEDAALNRDSERNIISMGNLSIVEKIEKDIPAEEIIDSLNLSGLFSYINGIKDEKYKIQAIILGCTHFPYLKEELEKLTDIEIIDPGIEMVKLLGK